MEPKSLEHGTELGIEGCCLGNIIKSEGGYLEEQQTTQLRRGELNKQKIKSLSDVAS